jgi:hypothetical protein
VSGLEADWSIRTIAFFGSDSGLLRDLRSIHVGIYGVESDTGLRISHLGLKKYGDESGHHLPECSTLLFLADEFDGVSDLVHVPF